MALREEYSRRISESGGSARLHRLLDGLFSSPVVTVPQAKDLTDVTYPAAKSDVDRLIKIEIL
ncbi:hypothetical protein [Thioflavicoccus mobilis]|uniref:hypothetical protein n=1 Tax=Thioflavicoccus mobilis TaxID=80679 RepID=UPI00030F1018|nr:hypothetical protein [Thioflavicoccus mobilis]